MMDGIRKVLSLFFSHKWKFGLSLLSTLVFLFLLFPFSDLGDLVATQVSKLTNNQIFVQFEQMHLSFFPEVGVGVENINFAARGFPELRADSVVVTPSVFSLITQKPAGSVTARGFMNGEIEASFRPTTRSENGVERHKITLEAKKISLNELQQVAQLPVKLIGSLNLDATATADLALQEQPDVELALNIDRFEMPIATVQTMMGPIALPELKLANVQLKGRLSAGKLLISQGTFGKDSDELNGTVKGELGLQLINQNGNIIPMIGSYNVEISLNTRKSFEGKAALFLNFIDPYKSATPTGSRFAFRLSGSSLNAPPNMSALR
jgi:type II secretion system protein N